MIDVRTTVNDQSPRSNFRLHPSGDFASLKAIYPCNPAMTSNAFVLSFLLAHGATDPVPHTTLRSYGMVEIK